MAKLRAANHYSGAKDLRLARRALILFLIALVVAATTAVASAAWQASADNTRPGISEPLEDGERQLEDGRSTLDEETLMTTRRVFEECTHHDSKNALCYYNLARTDSYLGKVKEAQRDKKAAEHWLDSAIENAKHAIVINDRSSDSHALLADLYGNKIGFGGMLAGMHYGPKANAETQRAFQLDANNPHAYTVVGRKYLFAPRMFGGDLEKAIESFQKATTLDPHYDEAFVWLAIAYRKKGDSQHADTALSEALRLNSRSAFAERVQSGTAVRVQ
jgi:tetratricopeptide (TPR) repeat protein